MIEPITFVCPACDATHDRGYFNGVDIFRCLKCGYIGHGLHPDPDIDEQVAAEIRESQIWNVAHGMEPGPFAP